MNVDFDFFCLNFSGNPNAPKPHPPRSQMDPEYILLFVNLIIFVSVLYNLYIEITSAIHFAFYRPEDESALSVRAWRPRVTIQFLFFAISFLLAVFVSVFSDGLTRSIVASFICMSIGFFANGFLFQICFLNDEGLGSVNDNFSMEIRWENIRDYRWTGQRLEITLHSAGLLRRKIFRFRDQDTALAVDRRIKRYIISDRREP